MLAGSKVAEEAAARLHRGVEDAERPCVRMYVCMRAAHEEQAMRYERWCC
jgi:hypothetical protein